jgi:hypothetical protein
MKASEKNDLVDRVGINLWIDALAGAESAPHATGALICVKPSPRGTQANGDTK